MMKRKPSDASPQLFERPTMHGLNLHSSTGLLLAVAALLLFGPVYAQGAANTMLDYSNARYGFSLRVPLDVFEPGETRNSEAGGLWVSRDRQARLVAAAQTNETKETLQSYRRFLMEQTYDQAAFDYTPMRDTWFVLSGTTKDGQLFYERVTFACEGRYIYGWQLVYPPAEKQRYDRIVEAVHRSYRVGQGPTGNCE